MNKNKNTFKTPEGYFEKFSDKLLDKISNLKGDQEETVLPKEDGFTIPDGYFGSFHANIKNRLDEEPSKVIALHGRQKLYYYAAAAVAAIALLTISIRTTMGEVPTFESLANIEIEDYFESYDLGLSTYEIAEVLPVDDLEISDIMDNQLEDVNIIEYLDDSIENFEELNLTDYEY
jgi:hypothetical protein